MTTEEDIILDQLYFVVPYQDLKEQSGLEEEHLLQSLISLFSKGWIKCFSNPEEEIIVNEEDLKLNFSNYHYLASKQGLLAHNLR